MDESSARLEKTLTSATFSELFEVQDPAKQNAILGQPGAVEDLHKLVQRTAAPMQARFLAAELLFVKQPDFPAAADAAALPEIYAWAVANQPTGNLWGLPGDDDGQAGRHVAKIGEPMVAALVPLFKDDRRLPYGGSIDATAADLWQVRVKDVAAALVSRIHGQEFPKQADKAARDTYIQELESKLRK
jgi:hypothetical protein